MGKGGEGTRQRLPVFYFCLGRRFQINPFACHHHHFIQETFLTKEIGKTRSHPKRRPRGAFLPLWLQREVPQAPGDQASRSHLCPPPRPPAHRLLVSAHSSLSPSSGRLTLWGRPCCVCPEARPCVAPALGLMGPTGSCRTDPGPLPALRRLEIEPLPDKQPSGQGLGTRQGAPCPPHTAPREDSPPQSALTRRMSSCGLSSSTMRRRC